MTSREGYDAYLLYLGIKLHFNSAGYNFVKYNGKVKADLPSFLKRNDKFHFAKLSRKYKEELKHFYIANLSVKDMWAGEMLENESHKRFTEWKKRNQKMSYLFDLDVSRLLDKKSIQEVLTVKNGQHPYLLKQYMAKNVSIETMCILDDVTGYSKKWNDLITETIVYPEVIAKIQKYKSFLNYDFPKFKQQLIQLCST
jgi:hypothetical protein|tara:strand:+ start:2990 stop:3583 length:594 start_codon:yes stop_codon:yes gene_type:complete